MLLRSTRKAAMAGSEKKIPTVSVIYQGSIHISRKYIFMILGHPSPIHKHGLASQCGYVVSTLASRQGDPGSNPRAAWKSCEVYPGLGILQPQWNPYPTLTPPSC